MARKKQCKHDFNIPDVMTCSKCGLVKDVTEIKYTLEQFIEEKKRAEKITETLEKMASVMEKFEDFSILIDHRVKQLEKKEKKHGKNKK